MSWNPLAAEVTVARRVIAFLGDRRVLFADESIEVLEHCVRSAHVGERIAPEDTQRLRHRTRAAR